MGQVYIGPLLLPYWPQFMGKLSPLPSPGSLGNDRQLAGLWGSVCESDTYSVPVLWWLALF